MIWTLIVELRISLVYPAVIVVMRRAQTALHAVVIVIAALALAILMPPLWALPLFVLGGLLARFRADVAAQIRLFPTGLVALLLGAGLVLAGIRYASGVAITGFAVHLASAAGATLLIALAAGGRLRVLACAPILFLGRISYGFYLVHLPLLIGLTSVLNPRCGVWVSVACAFTACVLVAALIHRYLEAPAQTLARMLTAKPRLKPA